MSDKEPLRFLELDELLFKLEALPESLPPEGAGAPAPPICAESAPPPPPPPSPPPLPVGGPPPPLGEEVEERDELFTEDELLDEDDFILGLFLPDLSEQLLLLEEELLEDEDDDDLDDFSLLGLDTAVFNAVRLGLPTELLLLLLLCLGEPADELVLGLEIRLLLGEYAGECFGL